jgi:hypothetical protein
MGSSRSANRKDGLLLCPKSFEMARRMLPWTKTNRYATPLGCASVLIVVLAPLALDVAIRGSDGVLGIAGYPVLALATLLGGFFWWRFARGWISRASDGE